MVRYCLSGICDSDFCLSHEAYPEVALSESILLKITYLIYDFNYGVVHTANFEFIAVSMSVCRAVFLICALALEQFTKV
jgi:hypothetical protein